MKTKSLFLGVLAVASLASCSDDKVTGISPSVNGEEITYSVVTNKATRATSLYSNSTKPESFYVWAFMPDDGSSVYNTNYDYICGDTIVTEDGGVTYTDVSHTYYWPQVSLDFYAFNGGEFDIEDKTITYEVESDVAEQEDLIYAVTPNQSSGTVNLNFRHALSQVVFKIEVTNPNVIIYNLKSISINNVYGGGSFTLPVESTSGNYTTNGEVDEPTPVEWTPSEESEATSGYTIDIPGGNLCVYESDGTIDILEWMSTGSAATHREELGKTVENYVMMLMPQKINLTGVETSYADGPYFTLNCSIMKRDSVAPGVDTLTPLFGDLSEGENINLPVAINWEAGKRYTYTFSLGNGDNAGVDDDDVPVLTAINYSVEVNDFVPVDEETVEMNANGFINGYRYVDMGLSVLWATANVGASSDNVYGDYYKWGYTTPGDYTFDKARNTYEVEMDDISGNADYDVARAEWGSTWRMPTKEEYEELIDNCDSE